MRITKREIIALREVLRPLKSDIINTKQASKLLLSETQLNLYLGNEEYISLEEITDISDKLVKATEQDYLDMIGNYLKVMKSYPQKDRLKKATKAIATMGLIKSGIRVGVQDNTTLLLNNISYVERPILTPKIVTEIYETIHV